jgi:hypothetical protein
MTAPTSTAELFDSGPEVRSPRRRWNRPGRGVLGLALVAATAVAAAFVDGAPGGHSSPSVAYVEAWVGAWNARDAQAVSSMTCDSPASFVAAGTIETYLSWVPAGRPVVARHTVTGTTARPVEGRSGVRVDVTYVSGTSPDIRRASVLVTKSRHGDPCIGYFTLW